MNILFTNAGRRTYLIQYALDLREEGYPIEIFVSDTNNNVPSFWISKSLHPILTPRVDKNEEQYFDNLLKYCKEHSIDLIIPLMDFELCVLAKNKDKFFEGGTKVLVSDFEVVNQCLDKKLTHSFCLENGIKTAELIAYSSLSDNDFPIIMKKIKGSGSEGNRIIKAKEALYDYDDKTYILQKYIKGTEYGLDILNDTNGNFVHACAKKKLAMRGGETDKASIEYSETIQEAARLVSEKFSHIGNMDADFIMNEMGEPVFIDFNPRFGGGYPFTHCAGFNYLKYLIDNELGRSAEIVKTKKNITAMKGINVIYYEDKD